MTAKDTLVIVNPASAGGRTARDWPRVQRCLVDAGVDFEPRMTSAAGDATRLAREALREGFARVVALGGDGTLNEVLNGFFDPETRQPVSSEAVLGMIPSGTGGDFRKSAGIPLAHAAACALLARGDSRLVDAGRVDYHGGGAPGPRWFVNIADCGIGGDVVRRVNASRKSRGGTVTFLYHSLAALATFGSRMVRVDIDGEAIEGPMQSVVVANGSYFGGGMRVAPGARLDDGLFDVVLTADHGLRRSLAGLPGLYKGRHVGRPGITVRRGRVVTVTPLEQRPVLFDVEGEQVGRAPATLTCLPGAIRLCAPAHD
jgi:diacylglycerol kinase (ATP)